MIEGNMVISGNYAPATILSLDKDALERILRLLCAKSLSKLRCVNRYFRELVENEMLWQSHVDVGWQKWSAELAEQRLAGRSRELYAFRAMLDSEAKRKLSELVWPLRRKAAEEWFAAHNVNVMVRPFVMWGKIGACKEILPPLCCRRASWSYSDPLSISHMQLPDVESSGALHATVYESLLMQVHHGQV